MILAKTFSDLCMKILNWHVEKCTFLCRKSRWLLLFAGPTRGGRRSYRIHDLAVTIHPEEQKLSGRDVLTVHRRGVDYLDLTLTRPPKVSSVTLDRTPVRFTFSDSILRIYFDDKAEKTRLDLRFRELRSVVQGSIAAKERSPDDNPGFGSNGDYRSPEGVFLLAGADWHPHSPGRKATIKDNHTRPGRHGGGDGRKAAPAKSRVRGSTSSEWLIDRPVEGIPLSAGPYVVNRKAIRKYTGLHLFFPRQPAPGPAIPGCRGHPIWRCIPGSSARMRLPNSRWWRIFFPPAMVFLPIRCWEETVIRLPFIIRTSLAHEVAHCWWGNGVLVDYVRAATGPKALPPTSLIIS